MTSVSALLDVWGRTDPAWAALSAEDRAVYIDVATARVSASAWGDLTNQGIASLALHLAASSPAARGSTAAGPVVAERVGQWARSYLAMPASAGDHWLSSSQWGAQFIELRESLAARAPRFYGA